MSRILVVDDEPAIGWGLREYLRDLKHEVVVAGSVEAVPEAAANFHPDAILLDVRLPGQDGLSAVHDFQARWNQVPVVIMTAFGDLSTAVRAMQQGAFEYLTKPFDLEQVGTALDRALSAKNVRATSSAKTTPALATAALVGSSPAMQDVFKAIALVAPTDVPVLILGETGTGKELAAQAIHRHSHRSSGPFIPVCLAALSSSVVESELFGHVRGAFTGAVDDRPGLIELAHQGTLFLDEIGDTPPAVQVKLLRFLETRQYTRVGSSELRTSNTRIVAATHRQLHAQIPRGEFREDLLFRLRGFEVRMPALRERPGDIPLLARAFLQQFAPQRTHFELEESFLEALQQRNWSGNVRELRSAIEHAAMLSRGGPLRVELLPAPLREREGATGGTVPLAAAVESWIAARLAQSGADADLYREFLTAVEPSLLTFVLKECEGNRAAAARRLGLDRTTLRTKLRSYGLESDGT